jgi:hypothetical protein
LLRLLETGDDTGLSLLPLLASCFARDFSLLFAFPVQCPVGFAKSFSTVQALHQSLFSFAATI